MNPYQAPAAPLQVFKSSRRDLVHPHQRAIAIVWYLLGAATGCVMVYDYAVGLKGGAPAFAYFIVLGLPGLGAAACIALGRMLWVSSTKARRTGTIIGSLAGLWMALMFVINLTNGITQSKPLVVLAAVACGAGFAFCVVSLKVSRRLAPA